MTKVLPISVMIATVGRPELLAACLDSIGRCDPQAAEIIVIDQSRDSRVREVVERLSPLRARTIALDVRNKSRALNLGLRQARHEIVLMTDDDCTVDVSWVAAAWAQMSTDTRAIVTGRVLPLGDSSGVPSTIVETTPRDHTGELHYGALYGNNMACNRSSVLALGGFDERFEAAEDNDLCYRWLRAGRSLRYEPDLLVWHHAWRTPAEMGRVYLAYGRGQGVFYAKHLQCGDLRITRFLGQDLYRGLRGVAARVVRGRSEWPDPRLGLLRGVAIGLVEGWRRPPSTRRRDRDTQ